MNGDFWQPGEGGFPEPAGHFPARAVYKTMYLETKRVCANPPNKAQSAASINLITR
jgi:hypothetical protein